VLTIDEAPNLAPEPEETHWIGDPAIDRDASPDVGKWAATGDVEALAVRDGAEAAVIKWRPLEELELNALPVIEDSGDIVLQFVAAAQYGLQEIEGVKLKRSVRKGLPLIQMGQMKAMAQQWRAPIPFWRTLDEWSKAGGNSGFKEAPDEVVSFPVWIGAVILARSFLERGR